VSRRGRITPEQAGLSVYAGTGGFRGCREEVALLAGISVEYYTRLERGNASGVSEDVLEALGRALQFDEAERAHLFDLARTLNRTRPPRRQPKQERVRPLVQRMIDAIVDMPAYVRNRRLDVLATNRLGSALYTPLFDDPARPVNVARFLFLNPHAGDFYVDWDTMANDAVAILRAEAGRDPYDKRLSHLIGELSTRSDDFRVRWAAHNVKLSCSFVKRLHHPVAGPLTLTYEALQLPNDADQMILVYAAEPNSSSAEALGLLASWTATPTDSSVGRSRTEGY
jgi:transcriptional regulator with XRE-family HTH domain